eukprot:NODE_300_length_10433_cov_0.716470.p8 type:complete len:197 gc:universal NODE_300_length_10433_cov_0.716470:6262-6852(+)
MSEDRYKKRIPEIRLKSGSSKSIECPDNVKNLIAEELLYLVNTSKICVKANENAISILDFWLWCDSFISLKWYRTYSKLRSVGYKFKGHWFVNPSMTNSYYCIPVESNAKIERVKLFAKSRLNIPLNPYVNSQETVPNLPNFQFAIQYFQCEIKNCENGCLFSIFDKDDTFILSAEKVDLENNALEKRRTIFRRVR